MTEEHHAAEGAPSRTAVTARQREIATEHLLFAALRHMAGRDPGLLDALEASVPHLWDRAHDETRDDEAVREVARTFIKSLRAVGSGT